VECLKRREIQNGRKLKDCFSSANMFALISTFKNLHMSDYCRSFLLLHQAVAYKSSDDCLQERAWR
jgi:hypothetical protein